MKKIWSFAIAASFAILMSVGCEKLPEQPDETPPPPAPEISIGKCGPVSPAGGLVSVEFIVTDPVENGLEEAEVTSDAAWAHDFTVSDGKITFTVDNYPATEDEQEDRTANVTFEYPGAEKAVFSVVQTAPEPVRPELTFEIKVKETTSYSFTYDCIPSDKAATYVLETKTREAFESYAGNFDKLIADDIEGFLAGGWSGPGDIESNLVSGDVCDEEDYFMYDEPSYIIAYGLDADGTVTTSTITYVIATPPPVPEIATDWDSSTIVPLEGMEYDVECIVTNPVEGGEIEPYCYSEWVHLTWEGTTVHVEVDSAAGSGESGTRTAYVFVDYNDASGSYAASTNFVITQLAE